MHLNFWNVYISLAFLSVNLAHAGHRNATEGPEHVGLDTRRRLKHEDATSAEQIHRNLEGKR